MFNKKTVFVVLALMLVSMFMTCTPYGYAMEIIDSYRKGTTESDTAAGDAVNDEFPRPADIGGITAVEHKATNDYIRSIRAWEAKYTAETRQGNHGEVIKIQKIPNLYNPTDDEETNRPEKGHFSIKGVMEEGTNVVYVYVDAAYYTEQRVNHEVEEYLRLADIALLRASKETSPYDAKVQLVSSLLDNPAKAEEANVLTRGVHAGVVAEFGEVDKEAIPDERPILSYVRPASGGITTHKLFFDISPQDWEALISPAQTVNPDVQDIFDQVYAVDGSKINEESAKPFMDYLNGKAPNEAVVAVFMTQAVLEAAQIEFKKATGFNLGDLVHLFVAQTGTLKNIEGDRLTALFNSVGTGIFGEVKIGAQVTGDYKDVAIAIGTGV